MKQITWLSDRNLKLTNYLLLSTCEGKTVEWSSKSVPTEKLSKWAFKVLLVGDAGVGKTDLMRSVADVVFLDSYRKRVGSSFGARLVFFDPAQIQLQMWNLTDHPRFEAMRRKFYKGGSGVIFVFSLNDRESFNNIMKWADEVKKEIGLTPAILVGTRPERDKKRRISQKEGKHLAKKLGVSYIETDIETDPHFEKGLQGLIKAILEHN